MSAKNVSLNFAGARIAKKWTEANCLSFETKRFHKHWATLSLFQFKWFRGFLKRISRHGRTKDYEKSRKAYKLCRKVAHDHLRNKCSMFTYVYYTFSSALGVFIVLCTDLISSVSWTYICVSDIFFDVEIVRAKFSLPDFLAVLLVYRWYILWYTQALCSMLMQLNKNVRTQYIYIFSTFLFLNCIEQLEFCEWVKKESKQVKLLVFINPYDDRDHAVRFYIA